MKHILEMCYPSSWWRDLWREGLVTGNGLTGANLYGGAKREILQLGRHDSWYDGIENELPDVHDALTRQRKKMDEGFFEDASWEIVNALREKGYSSKLESPLPIANLIVEQTPIEGFDHFKRELDMDKAVARNSWIDAGVKMSREVFVSRVEDMVVYRLQAQEANTYKERLEYRLSLNAYMNEGETPTEAIQEIWSNAISKAVCEDDHTGYLYFNSEKKAPNGILKSFGAVAKIDVKSGRITKKDDSIYINSAEQVLVKILLYVDEDKESAWKNLHNRLAYNNKTFKELLDESSILHSKIYNRAELKIGDVDEDKRWSRTNEELVMEAFTHRQPIELIEKLWYYGRYLFVCGTSPEANPFPLYGLWGGGYQPLWPHNMANENMQMIYWHSLCGNLLDYNKAIFKYMNDRIPVFKENAQKLFGINGIYMTAGTTPGVSAPTQVVPVIVNWVSAAGWIAQHYYQYFRYTKDMDYAMNVMIPYLNEVAIFYEEFVCFTVDDNGNEKIKFYPSVSPENSPSNFVFKEEKQMDHPMPTTINSTIDLAIMREFFTNMLEICDECEGQTFSSERIDKWKRILKAIPEFEVNEDGAIKEWQEDIFEDRYEHRHLSHIYPVFPGYTLYPEKNPDKIDAYEKAVGLRKIDAQTGWSMTHMAAIYARFRKGDLVMKCLDNMARSALLNNFFTLHNDWRGMNISIVMDPAPVQLDAIMGYVNAVQESILYVSPGYIALLPALEERMYVGEVKNFRYCDGTINMKWDCKNHYFKCEIIPIRLHKVQVVLPDFVDKVKWSQESKMGITQIRKNTWEIEFYKDNVGLTCFSCDE